MLSPEDDYQPIRALNDLLFCERRCSMHRLEQIWVENRFTIEGSSHHARAHEPAIEATSPGVRIARGMWLRSDRLRLVGRADIVEFLPEPRPVEYKRGKRKKWDNDDVQLCAQALCLEEMFDVHIPQGAIYHASSKRRRSVEFGRQLRDRTEASIKRLHEMLAYGETPPPVLKPRCRGCSVRDVCMPEVFVNREQITRLSRSMYTPSNEPYAFE